MAEEKELNYLTDVKNANLRDIIAEEAKVEEVTPEVTETKDPEPTPPINTDELKAQLKEELDAEFKEREQAIVEKTTTDIFNKLNPNATKEEQDEVAIFLKEHPEPSWQDAFKFLSNSSKVSKEEVKAEILADLNKEVETEDAKTKEAEALNTKNQEDNKKAWNTYWDGQLADLEAKGHIPPIKDIADENDPGRKARVELFSKMAEIRTTNLAKGLAEVTNLKEIYYENFLGKGNLGKRVPAGADAPVAGARKGVSSEGDKDFSYNQIHKQSIYDILSGK